MKTIYLDGAPRRLNIIGKGLLYQMHQNAVQRNYGRLGRGYIM